MGVRDEVSANRCAARHVLVRVHETVQLGHGPHVRQADERGDIPEGFVRRQRRREDARMRGDAQVRHQRRPGQTEYFRASCARLEKAAGADVTVILGTDFRGVR